MANITTTPKLKIYRNGKLDTTATYKPVLRDAGIELFERFNALFER